MKIVLKPMGVAVLLIAIILLTGLAFFRNKTVDSMGGSTPSPALPVTAISLTPKNVVASASDAGLVYEDGMHGGWETYGWTKELNWSETAHARGGKGVCIRAVLQPYEGIYMHHIAPVDITSYDRLTFYLNGGDQGGQSLMLVAAVGDTKRVTFNLPPPPAKQWKLYTISLKAMGIAGAKDLNGFWIWSSQAQPALFIDDVRFLKPGQSGPTDAMQ